jgi:hypothetical protein
MSCLLKALSFRAVDLLAERSIVEPAKPETKGLRAHNMLPLAVAVAINQLLEITDLARPVLDLAMQTRRSEDSMEVQDGTTTLSELNPNALSTTRRRARGGKGSRVRDDSASTRSRSHGLRLLCRR